MRPLIAAEPMFRASSPETTPESRTGGREPAGEGGAVVAAFSGAEAAGATARPIGYEKLTAS